MGDVTSYFLSSAVSNIANLFRLRYEPSAGRQMTDALPDMETTITNNHGLVSVQVSTDRTKGRGDKSKGPFP